MRTKISTIVMAIFIAVFISCRGEDKEKPETGIGETKQKVIHEEEAKIPLPINHELAQKGEELFKTKGCTACHSIGEGRRTGPDLAGVTQRRKLEWIENWVLHPEVMVENDPIAREMLAIYMVKMPNQNLTPEEAKAVIMYLREKDSEAKGESQHNAKD